MQRLCRRRAVIGTLLLVGGGIGALPAAAQSAAAVKKLAAIPAPTRESAMRRAIAVARRNAAYPFGAISRVSPTGI